MASNKKVFVLVGIGCLAAALAVVVLIGVVVFGVFAVMKQSDGYAASLERVKTHPAALAALGTPIKAGVMVLGSVNVENDSGSADLSYSVSGPNGAGTVSVVGTKSGGVWTYSRMELVLEGSRESIDLLDAP